MPDKPERVSNRALVALAGVTLLLLSWLFSSRAPTEPPRSRIAAANGGGGFRPIQPLPVSAWPPSHSGGDFLASIWPPPPPPQATELVEADFDPWSSPALRSRPGVRSALRKALRAALHEAERNASADPLELLATRLMHTRQGGASAGRGGFTPPGGA